MCVFGLKSLNFNVKRTIFLSQNKKMQIFLPKDNFKQASKQKRMVGRFLII
jgi:hypothetical protein